MNRQELLKEYKRQEDKICLSNVLDKLDFVNKRERIEFTDFLDMYQISLVESFLKKNTISNYLLYGGYDDSERRVLVIYPDRYNDSMINKNLSKMLQIVRVKLPSEEFGKYVHRNYLGAIVKLGLKREKVGDILVQDDGADIICLSSFSDILVNELPSLTRFSSSEISVNRIEDLRIKEIEVEEIKIIVPSLRLDNVVSDLIRSSRNKATEVIKQERCFVNGKCEVKMSKQIKVGDVLTIRGKGRFIIKDILGSTRSGRTIISVEKFV